MWSKNGSPQWASARPVPSRSRCTSTEVSFVVRVRLARRAAPPGRRSVIGTRPSSHPFGSPQSDLQRGEEAIVLRGRPDRHPKAPLEPRARGEVTDQDGVLEQRLPHLACRTFKGPEQHEVRVGVPRLHRHRCERPRRAAAIDQVFEKVRTTTNAAWPSTSGPPSRACVPRRESAETGANWPYASSTTSNPGT